MQIDTWNRAEMDISSNAKAKFIPGPMPASSMAPAKDPEYSGLLECPMTTRIAKAIDGTYAMQTVGTCGEKVETFQECFHGKSTRNPYHQLILQGEF